MKIYCVIIEDRHADVMVYPFTDPEVAISEARRIAKDFCRHEEDYQELDVGRAAGWLFYAVYSGDDHVRVVTTELDKKTK
jgi:hypothetical protein